MVARNDVQSSTLQERTLHGAAQNKRAFVSWARVTAGGRRGAATSALRRLTDLRTRGALTDAVFELQKAKVLAAG